MIYLELGVLLIEAEIYHHILNLESTDPVLRLLEEKRTLPEEPNWANEIKKILSQYGIEMNNNTTKAMSKESWKHLVENSVTKLDS